MRKNDFIEGAVIATLSIIITKIIGVLYVIPFYRIVGEKGGALYGYAYNIYNIFLIISTAGIPLALSKLTSEYQTKSEISKKITMFKIAKKYIYLFSIVSFLICFVFAKPLATLILGNLSGGNTIKDITYVIKAVSFAILIVPLLSISRGYLQGHKYITVPAVSQVIEQIVRIFIILVGSYISLKVFKLPLSIAVSVSVFAACVGAIASYLYLEVKMRIQKRKEKNVKLDKITKKDEQEIIKKLVSYSIPFIVINIANNLYNTTDMILLIRGLKMVGYNAVDIENISSIFTTWGVKISSIVTSIAAGLVTSLIPSLVEAYTKKDQTSVNIFFNKTLLVILFVITPITIFLSINANEVWHLFYSTNKYGPIILRFTILVAILDSAYIMICCALQALYKTRLIYIAVISGLLFNVISDIPFLLLFDKLGLYPFYGVIIATICGYLISLTIPLITLKKTDKINYKETTKKIPVLIISMTIFTLICIFIKKVYPIHETRMLSIIYLGISAIVTFGIYYVINHKVINYIIKENFKKKI